MLRHTPSTTFRPGAGCGGHIPSLTFRPEAGCGGVRLPGSMRAPPTVQTFLPFAYRGWMRLQSPGVRLREKEYKHHTNNKTKKTRNKTRNQHTWNDVVVVVVISPSSVARRPTPAASTTVYTGGGAPLATCRTSADGIGSWKIKEWNSIQGTPRLVSAGIRLQRRWSEDAWD
mgnify:CR=1 FL=1